MVSQQRREHSASPHPDFNVQRLFGGAPFVVSFDNTSQYAQGGNTASSCGLISLNAVRMVLDVEQSGTRNIELLKHISSRKFVEDVVSISSVWASDTHLELDDIYTLPLFDRSLVLVHSVYEQPTKPELKQLLQELRRHGEQASAKNRWPISIGVVITRPPEIFCILKLPTPGQRLDDVFVIFDSHPRPSSHPNGAAFLFFPTLDQTVDYVSELLHVDSALLDGEMSWQVQLFSQYSGHFFVARKHRMYDTDSISALYDANMSILDLKLSQTDCQARIRTLESENDALRARIKYLEKGKMPDLSQAPEPAFRSQYASSSSPSASPSYAAPEITKGDVPSNDSADLLGRGSRLEQESLLLAYHLHSGMDVSRDRDPPSRWSPNLPSDMAGPSSSNPRASSLTVWSGKPQDSRDSTEVSELEKESRSAEQQSLLLAYELQETFSAEDSNLRAQLHILHSSQPAVFQCGICFENCPVDDVCPVDEGHNFCRGCLKLHITVQLGDHRFPIICPLCIADKTIEPQPITRIQAEQLGLSQEQAELWTELELARFSLMLPCPKCQRFAFVDREDHTAMDVLYCPLQCGYTWCKTCQQPVVHGLKHSCDGAEELKRLMKDKGYKTCPGCNTPTEKIYGCNHMTCEAPHCNTHFCYKCGGFIVQSLSSAQIKTALEAHYGICTLFDVPT